MSTGSGPGCVLIKGVWSGVCIVLGDLHEFDGSRFCINLVGLVLGLY